MGNTTNNNTEVRDVLTAELRRRGVVSAVEIAAKCPAAAIESTIRWYDDQLRQGDFVPLRVFASTIRRGGMSGYETRAERDKELVKISGRKIAYSDRRRFWRIINALPDWPVLVVVRACLDLEKRQPVTVDAVRDVLGTSPLDEASA